MNKKLFGIVSCVLYVGSVAGPAFAGVCSTENRPVPAVQDIITVSCRNSNGVTSTGQIGIGVNGGTKTIRALLQAGQNVASVFARGRGLDNNGNVLCTVTDAAPVDGNSKTVTCNAAVRWRAELGYPN